MSINEIKRNKLLNTELIVKFILSSFFLICIFSINSNSNQNDVKYIIYSNNTQSVLSGRLLVDGALACVTVLQLYRIFSAVQRSEPAMVPYYTYYKPVEER